MNFGWYFVIICYIASQRTAGELIKNVIDGLAIKQASSYLLVTFNDGDESEVGHTTTYGPTPDYAEFIKAVDGVEFKTNADNHDVEEQMFKGEKRKVMYD